MVFSVNQRTLSNSSNAMADNHETYGHDSDAIQSLQTSFSFAFVIQLVQVEDDGKALDYVWTLY